MKKLNKNTFDAKVDVVMFPDNINCYSQERNDYTELALTAIKQKASVIKYISPSYKDYPKLCEEAINQDYKIFPLIDDDVSNYKQLGVKAITMDPFVVSSITKKKYYYFFWKTAISICYKVLKHIDQEKQELFPLIEEAIRKEPLAIYFVNSNIPIYNKLCNIAYSKNNESVRYMNINRVDEDLVFKIIDKEPDKVKYLYSDKNYYKKAWRVALSLNGKLIKNFNYSSIKNDLDYLFELINIAENSDAEIVDYSIVFRALCLENRERKNKILCTTNIFGDNIYELLKGLDDEYESLSKMYAEVLFREMNEEKNVFSNSISDCPIRMKTRRSSNL